ncbi:F1F0 ATP synthase assembly Atp11 [Pyrenophora seminiperda CCB06]|uniref:F1F0 ATP synthase assembly Atp11 n=1 Tax=Pyrenophora seminiperda CCB06 TaxID=1302712 RepID=A0A3M7MH87_9PLEO|nr:F1F0 ATP synthase assembly Atp11 [Pyrenophora seminiperda CCB06]
MPLQLPALRHALRQPLVNARATQRRWAQVRRFLVTDDSQERILAKYREKLESKAKQKGLKDLDELREQYKDKIEELRKQAIVPGATGPLAQPPPSPPSLAQQASASPESKTTHPSSSKWPSPPPPPGAGSPTAPPPGLKTLSSLCDVELFAKHSKKEIEELWRLRGVANPQSLHFSVPATTFSQLLRTAKQHPTFVLPVPRQIPADGSPAVDGQTQQAAELHYLQFAHPHEHTTTLMFTTLAEFKLRGEFASPHTTVSFHRELVDSHELVLGHGSIIEGRGVSLADATWLVMCMQKFYVHTAEGKGRSELLDLFTRGDSAFQVDRLIDEAERLL